MMHKILLSTLTLATVSPAGAMNDAMKATLEEKLFVAVNCDYLEKAQKYIAKGAPTDASLLLIAIRHKLSLDMVKLLIDNCADIDEQPIHYDPYLCPAERRGNTPLMLAAAAKRIDICKLLLDKGAEVNIEDSWGLNALYWAKKDNNRELITLLKEHGAMLPKKKDCCPSTCSIL